VQRAAPGASFSPEDGTVAGRTERSVNSREMVVNHPYCFKRLVIPPFRAQDRPRR
jgi:hypothetical protein